ncbi:hypothetical protein CFOL_v3_17680, partial [Cephalotus follicularis]
MALAAHSVCVSLDDIVSTSCIRSGLLSNEMFHSRKVVHFQIRFKSRKLRHTQSIKSYKNYRELDLSCSNRQSSRKDKVSSMFSTKTSMPEVFKQWSPKLLLKVAGVLACALLVIPSADAVDALKTCTCLLKECRKFCLCG